MDNINILIKEYHKLQHELLSGYLHAYGNLGHDLVNGVKNEIQIRKFVIDSQYLLDKMEENINKQKTLMGKFKLLVKED